MYPKCYGDNPRFPHPNDFQVVQRAGSFGKGVICNRTFNPGDFIAEIAGEVIDEMTQHSLQIEPSVHLSDLYFSGYFLHSCDPNVSLDMRNRRVFAVRSIEKSDFLEMDYAETELVLYKQFACSCGSNQCRGWITGSTERPNELDPDYLNFIQRVRVTA